MRDQNITIVITQEDRELAYEFTRTGWMKGSDGIHMLAEIAAKYRRQAEARAFERAAAWLEAGDTEEAEELSTDLWAINKEQRGRNVFNSGAYTDRVAAAIRALKETAP